MPTDMSEGGLETLIEQSLIQQSGYIKSYPNDYDRTHCIDKTQLLEFLRITQPQAVNRLITLFNTNFEEKLFKRIYDQIKNRGIIDVLRNGIQTQDIHLTLYYKQPASQLNPEATKRYNNNRFSVTRQLRHSEDNKKLEIDIVIFINGLPLITFELKNNLTKRNVKDAIKQYKKDRDPKEPLFNFGRCLVHFAVDEELVYMTTKLEGQATIFLPFNKGKKSQSDLPFPDSAGNPVNPSGIKTDYLWKQILSKSILSNIIEKYAQIIEEKSDSKPKRQQLIFPRYHQLDLVEKLLTDTKEKAIGQRYLIQHSTGSGKSNSITWLSWQLVELCDPTNTNPIFNSVIVVTDRRILDKQIRDNIKQFEQVKGVVQPITESSEQLRQALEDGKKLIITTVQKFSFIVNQIKSLADKRFAIIIDEAHSSQSGLAAAKMNTALSKEESEEETIEDKIIRIIEEQKLSQNANYYAFTATPKNKTIETFGTRNPIDGKFYPFHLYSMKQAIEEGFILDILQNYTTYNSYYKLQKKIEDDPKFDNKRAQKRLKKYVENHPHAISQKTEIMVEHFLEEIIAQRKINGQAKAMIVTSGVEAAIRYKLTFDAYLQERRSPYKTIIAFSQTKEVNGIQYDEASLNRFPSKDIPDNFKKSEYRFLIVADKYQTGFDEPLLHTMYVDKRLSDVKAVQTLSRLNRAYPGKTDTFILDFVNSVDTIKAAFEPFYQTTILSEESDIDRLNDLQTSLDAYQVYSSEEINQFMRGFIEGVEREKLDPILDSCVETFKQDLERDQQIDFKAKAKSFLRYYQFLVQIRTFRNPYWESLKTFLKFLIAKLPILGDRDLAQGIIESVDIDSYRISIETTQAIRLQGSNELQPTPPQLRGNQYQLQLDFLSNIIREFNTFFGNIIWTDTDKIRRTLFEDLPQAISADEEYQNARQFSDRQNARITFEKALDEKFQDLIYDQTELYRQYTDNRDFNRWVKDKLFTIVYEGIKTLQQQPIRRADNPQNPAIIWRGSTGQDLLSFAATWAGDDLDECLQTVYDNRTEAEF